MGFLIGFLTLVMVVDCLILILLVLIQLPKKEAGAGLAFGGSATDALFGAGSGTVLTKITKYAAGAFFVMALILSILQSNYHRRTATEFGERIEKPPVAAPMTAPGTATTPAQAPQAVPGITNKVTIPAEATNVPPATTNAASTVLTNLPTTNLANPTPK